ncbi:aldose 1-epimerase family protein [Cellulomonas sp. HZM]|uniref:aldose 1-epimerase family protein n=1 Tax=Cellulomonas sp. HZM TaxID=1454010 RepID=UPI0004932DA1|nr:aldose 1-epimerase family protein [Cellulomonas sp. HZM]
MNDVAAVLPTRTQHALTLGDQRAVVAAVGASLRSYTVGERDVVLPFDENDPAPAFSGAVLAPWPNRLADGEYVRDGVTYEVPITEHARRTALHGLVSFTEFALTSSSGTSVTLEHTTVPTHGYPWQVRVSVTYTLTDDGLHVTIEATNVGTGVAPYGTGVHPWLSPGDAAVDDCTLSVGAARHVLVDDRLLPTGDEPVGPGTDLREPLALRGVAFDDAWTSPERDTDGRSWARFTSPDGRTVAMWADEAAEAWQVCTGDGIPLIERRGVAVEPMTCIADAFRTGEDLVELAPGGQHVLTWGLRLE